MNIQFQFHHVSDVLKEDIKTYATKRFEHLERFLTTFQEDNKLLTLSLEHHEKHNMYQLKCTLLMGGKTIHHDEETHDPKEAIDKAEANLVRQAKKQLELLRDGR